MGVFIKNRGDQEVAKKYLMRCERADDWQQINHVLACQLLRTMKVPVPPEDAPSKSPARGKPQQQGVNKKSPPGPSDAR